MFGLSGWFDLIVETEGFLCLPAAVTAGLGLVPGDLVSMEVIGAASLRLRLYRELLAGDWEALAPAIRASFLEEILSHPLAAFEEGRIEIPAEILPLRPGDGLVLQVMRRGLEHDLYLFRNER